MRLRDVMTIGVITVDADDPASDARATMRLLVTPVRPEQPERPALARMRARP
jgi:hypothetical protein